MCVCVIMSCSIESFAEVNECASNPCQNAGACQSMLGAFSCECCSGFTGPLCETDINECSSAPCVNGGECEDMEDGYVCTCDDSYFGDECQYGKLF